MHPHVCNPPTWAYSRGQKKFFLYFVRKFLSAPTPHTHAHTHWPILHPDFTKEISPDVIALFIYIYIRYNLIIKFIIFGLDSPDLLTSHCGLTAHQFSRLNTYPWLLPCRRRWPPFSSTSIPYWRKLWSFCWTTWGRTSLSMCLYTTSSGVTRTSSWNWWRTSWTLSTSLLISSLGPLATTWAWVCLLVHYFDGSLFNVYGPSRFSSRNCSECEWIHVTKMRLRSVYEV